MTTFPRDKRAHDAWATDFERRAVGSRLCAHNYVTDAVRRDPTLDNNEVQRLGQERCRAAQIAAMAKGQE
jgi:hypothetical protein